MTTKADRAKRYLDLADDIDGKDTYCSYNAEKTSEIATAMRRLAEIESLEPVAYQFEADGRWFNYMNEKHRQDTLAAGFKERGIYSLPEHKEQQE